MTNQQNAANITPKLIINITLLQNKLGLSCAKLRQANLLRLLLLENSELCKCEKRSTSTEVN